MAHEPAAPVAPPPKTQHLCPVHGWERCSGTPVDHACTKSFEDTTRPSGIFKAAVRLEVVA
jgi:hypothetical protein